MHFLLASLIFLKVIRIYLLWDRGVFSRVKNISYNKQNEDEAEHLRMRGQEDDLVHL